MQLGKGFSGPFVLFIHPQYWVGAGVAEGEGPQVSAGTAAWRVLGAEAWRLLDSGRLRNAARLSAALSAVGGSMPALLLSCRPPDRPLPTPLSIARGALPLALIVWAHKNLKVAPSRCSKEFWRLGGIGTNLALRAA